MGDAAMLLRRTDLWLAESACAAAFLLHPGLQLAIAGSLGNLGALLRGGLFLMPFTLPIALLAAGMPMVSRRPRRETLRSGLPILPAGCWQG